MFQGLGDEFSLDLLFFRMSKSKSEIHVPKFSKQLVGRIPAIFSNNLK